MTDIAELEAQGIIKIIHREKPTLGLPNTRHIQLNPYGEDTVHPEDGPNVTIGTDSDTPPEPVVLVTKP